MQYTYEEGTVKHMTIESRHQDDCAMVVAGWIKLAKVSDLPHLWDNSFIRSLPGIEEAYAYPCYIDDGYEPKDGWLDEEVYHTVYFKERGAFKCLRRTVKPEHSQIDELEGLLTASGDVFFPVDGIDTDLIY